MLWLLPLLHLVSAQHVIKSEWLRIGPGTSDSLLPDGGLGQPFYKSNVTGWTKLTYSNYEIDFSFKVDGQLARIANDVTLNFVNSSYAESTAQLVLDGVPQATLKRTYNFLFQGVVFQTSLEVTALRDLDSIEAWMGTADDWIGSTDKPTKEQGVLTPGGFKAKAHGTVMHLFSGQEEVFIYSPHKASHAIILSHYGRWSDVYGSQTSDLSSSTSDGAYGIYVPLGHATRGQVRKASIFYAALGPASGAGIHDSFPTCGEAAQKGKLEEMSQNRKSLVQELEGARERE
ncbi:unnamed protein product [Effrenium voratum]|nr:unnamed protein product [Effrenium voratum]